ncbi:MAG: hypothetical protein ACYCR7_08145 [Thermoplasmataceae archaeon]
MFSRLFEVFGKFPFPKLVTFATVMNISYADQKTQVLDTVFGDIMTRFNTFMVRQHNTGHPTKGLAIIDQAHENKYRELFNSYRIGGTKYGLINNIVDIPYFAGRKGTRMLQFVDLLAYGVFQHYEHSRSAYFDLIKTKFDRRFRGGPPVGLKHLTKEQCSCYSCERRKFPEEDISAEPDHIDS